MKSNDYQAQDDAHTLMRAQEVMSDKKRHTKAKKHLDSMSKDKAKESLHAKVAKGLQKAFPPNMAPASQGGDVSTVNRVNRVPNLNTQDPDKMGSNC
jgi:hypothetical protein